MEHMGGIFAYEQTIFLEFFKYVKCLVKFNGYYNSLFISIIFIHGKRTIALSPC